MPKDNVKVILLTPQSEKESSEKLGFDTRLNLYGTIEDFLDTIVIRWGYGYSAYNRAGKECEYKHFITNYKNIQTNCNKLESTQKLSKVVLTPKIYTKNVPKGKLVVVRPFAHSRGENFEVKKGPLKLKGKTYAADFIKCEKEIRAFYCNGKVMVVSRVTQNEQRLKEKYKCRSLWPYSKPWKKVSKILENQVLKAAKHLGFQYGAFDILCKNDKYIFLENNTAPSLDSNFVINFYKTGIDQIVNKKTKQVEKYLKENPVAKNTFKVINFDKQNAQKFNYNNSQIVWNKKTFFAGL